MEKYEKLEIEVIEFIGEDIWTDVNIDSLNSVNGDEFRI